jgi:putative ATPase
LLFVDEIHRFNRAQQDGFLPFVEEGIVTLVGATTENPSFELNGALLSRCQVFVLKRLDDEEALSLLAKAEAARAGPCRCTRGARRPGRPGRRRRPLPADPVGDPVQHRHGHAAEPKAWARFLQKRSPAYDKDREEHYNLISALHKSMRGSDPDAALYWLARMLTGGEDPLFIARRLVRMAAEDIGEADPYLLLTWRTRPRTPMTSWAAPRASWRWPRLTVHLATAPKSNAVYKAYKARR